MSAGAGELCSEFASTIGDATAVEAGTITGDLKLLTLTRQHHRA